MPESTALTVTAWVGAVLTVLGALWKATTTVWKMASRIQDMWELVEQELQPNGGESLKDRVNQINRRLEAIETLRAGDIEADVAFRSLVLKRLHIIDGGPIEIEGVPV